MAAREPAFFKVIAQECFERIQIAPGYTKYKEGNLPSTVILKDQYGNHWHMDVEKHQNELFFAKGWKKFIEENHMEIGDFIVFNYGGPNIFDVTLLGHNSCDKEGVGGLKTEEDQEENFEAEEGKEEAEEKEKEILEDSKDKSTDQDQIEFNVQKKDNNDHDNEDNNDDEDEAKGQMKREKQGQARADKAKHGSKSQVDARVSKIFADRNISPPKNPYFVTKIRRGRKDQLYVPVDVIKDHNLDLPECMLLQDPQGREWYTKLTTWNDGRKWYFGGWASLCRVNLVQEGDFLVCEFVEEVGKKGLFLKVDVLHAGDNVRV